MKAIDIDCNTLLMLAIAAAGGALGGMIRWVKVRKEPLAHILVGLAAAVGAMYVARPTDAFGLIAGAIVFGWAGEAVLDALGAHAKVVIAEKHAKEAKQEAKDASKKHHKAEGVIDAAIASLEKKPKKQTTGRPEDLVMGPQAYVAEVESDVALEILKKHRAEES
jgi:hypothetical protein